MVRGKILPERVKRYKVKFQSILFIYLFIQHWVLGAKDVEMAYKLSFLLKDHRQVWEKHIQVSN